MRNLAIQIKQPAQFQVLLLPAVDEVGFESPLSYRLVALFCKYCSPP